MDFPSSSQCKRWMYTLDSLAATRQETRDAFIKEAEAAGRDVTAASPYLISLTDEAGLLRHYQEKILAVCLNLKLPRKVISTSVCYLKRFYLKRSALEHDPQHMCLVCLYIACKIEDCYISAAELGRLVGMSGDVFLKLELVLLQGLEFDLQVHSLFRALEGVMSDLGEWIAAAAISGLEQPGVDNIQLDEAKASAYRSGDALLLSDGPLVFTPGQLGLAAVNTALAKVDVDIAGAYITHVAGRGNGGSASSEQLMRVVSAIESLKTVAEPLSKDDVVSVDRNLKSYRKALGSKNGK